MDRYNKEVLRKQNDEYFIEILKEVCNTTRLLESRNHIQHGDTTVFEHVVVVAYTSMRIAELLHLKLDRRELIRGALLHDYFLYDWHNQDTPHKLHGFTHPSKALKNALMDTNLTSIEMDIIRKHMFPMTITPPVYKESFIVCIADKICATFETLNATSLYKNYTICTGIY